MGLLNANFMGLYVYEDSSSSPFRVHVTASEESDGEDAVQDFWDNGSPLPANDDFAFIVKPNGIDLYKSVANTYGKANRPLVGTIQGTDSPRSADASGFKYLGQVNTGNNGENKLDLVAAATNTSIDVSRAIDEVVSKGAQCESETYTTVGASSWNVTADGLITNTLTADETGATAILDLARDKKYCLVRFVLNNQAMHVSSEDEDHVQYWGQGIIESVSLSGSFDSTQTYTATIRGYGNLMRFDANDSQ